jgi:hypothetical protein
LEVLMPGPAVALPLPTIPHKVQAFAAERDVGRYLPPLIDLARQVFPSSVLGLSLGQDAEDETHQYIAIEVEFGGRQAEELLAGQAAWSAGVSRVCPSHHAVYFVLGWR